MSPMSRIALTAALLLTAACNSTPPQPAAFPGTPGVGADQLARLKSLEGKVGSRRWR